MRRGLGASSQAKQAASQQPRETAGGGEGLERPVDFGSDGSSLFLFFFPSCAVCTPAVQSPDQPVKSKPPHPPCHKDRQLNRDGSPSPLPPPCPTWPLSPSGCRNYPPRFMFLPLLDFHALPDLCFPGPGQVGKHCVASLTFQRSLCDSL